MVARVWLVVLLLSCVKVYGNLSSPEVDLDSLYSSVSVGSMDNSIICWCFNEFRSPRVVCFNWILARFICN